MPTYSAGHDVRADLPGGGAAAADRRGRQADRHRPAAVGRRAQGRAAARRGRAPRRRSGSPSPAAGAAVATRAEVVADGHRRPGLPRVTFAAQVGDGPWQPARHRRPARRTGSTTTSTAWPAARRCAYKAVVRDGRRPHRVGDGRRRRSARRRSRRDRGLRSSCTTSARPATTTLGPVHLGRHRPGVADDRGRPGSRSPARTPTAGSPGSSSSRARATSASSWWTRTASRTSRPTGSSTRAATPRSGSSRATRRCTRRAAAATGTVDVHYGRPDGAYAGWGLHLWGDGLAPGAGTDWATPAPAGRHRRVRPVLARAGRRRRPSRSTSSSTAETRRIPDADQSRRPDGQGEAWVRSGEATVHPTRAAAEDTAVLHYRRADGDYAGWGLHVWDGAANPTDWTSAAAAGRHRRLRRRVPGAAGRRRDRAELHPPQGRRQGPARRPAARPGRRRATRCGCWPGSARYLLPHAGGGGAPDTDLTKARAHWIDRDTVAWRTGPTDGRRYELVYAPAGGLSIVDGELTGGVHDASG